MCGVQPPIGSLSVALCVYPLSSSSSSSLVSLVFCSNYFFLIFCLSLYYNVYIYKLCCVVFHFQETLVFFYWFFVCVRQEKINQHIANAASSKARTTHHEAAPFPMRTLLWRCRHRTDRSGREKAALEMNRQAASRGTGGQSIGQSIGSRLKATRTAAWAEASSGSSFKTHILEGRGAICSTRGLKHLVGSVCSLEKPWP